MKHARRGSRQELKWARAAAGLFLVVSGPTGPQAASPGKDGSWYSPLAEIDANSIGKLDRVFEASLGSSRGSGGAVGTAGHVLVAQTPLPSAMVALAPGEGSPMRWQFEPPANRMALGLPCCSAGRQPAMVGDKLLVATLDGHVFALEAGSGAPVWDRAVADPAKGEILSGELVPAAGRILVGNAAEATGARGWIAALDLADGIVGAPTIGFGLLSGPPAARDPVDRRQV